MASPPGTPARVDGVHAERLFVGITDRAWWEVVRTLAAEELNLWRPHQRRFRALEPGGVYLFRLHAPDSAVVGGARFVEEHLLPLSLAWLAFGQANGATDPHAFRQRFERAHPDPKVADPVLSCVVLRDAFFLDEAEWIQSPEDWRPGVAHGRLCLDDEAPELREMVAERLGNGGRRKGAGLSPDGSEPGPARWRLRVVEAYARRCAMTGEREVSSLEVVQVLPRSQGGLRTVDNALCLRTDLSRLFEHGLLTVEPERLRVRASPLLRDGQRGLDGRTLTVLPERFDQMPSPEALEFHASSVFRG